MTARSATGTAKVTPLAGANAVPAHAAMHGQFFAQSAFWVSGQHGMPSGMSSEAWSTAAATIWSGAASVA